MSASELPAYPVAHSPNGLGRWHGLAEHLEAVSSRAHKFGEKFGVADWAALAGLWHDLGKYHPDFQQMLEDAVNGRPLRRVDHSTLGAIHADQLLGPVFTGDPRRKTVEFLTLLKRLQRVDNGWGRGRSRPRARVG
jgi:hypothetical protein